MERSNFHIEYQRFLFRYLCKFTICSNILQYLNTNLQIHVQRENDKYFEAKRSRTELNSGYHTS